MQDNEKDTAHNWVWSLKRGDRVWLANEESVAQGDRFLIEFMDETAPMEYERVDEVFNLRELIVVDNWTLTGCDGETHIVSMEFADPSMRGQLRFACQCGTRDLNNFFSGPMTPSSMVVATHIFRTPDECREFCRSYISMHYSSSLCDEMVAELEKMIAQIKAVKHVCVAYENDDERFFNKGDKQNGNNC